MKTTYYEKPPCPTSHRLNVKVSRLTNLTGPKFGSCNAYVVCELREKMKEDTSPNAKRTTTKVMNNLNPEWQPSADLTEWRLNFEPNMNTSLFVQVLDWDRFWDDTCIGYAMIQLDDFNNKVG